MPKFSLTKKINKTHATLGTLEDGDVVEVSRHVMTFHLLDVIKHFVALGALILFLLFRNGVDVDQVGFSLSARSFLFVEVPDMPGTK